jgi:hypothetical protein
MIVRIRVGWETLLIAPRVELAGLIDSDASTADPLSSEYEVRRCLIVALHDPAIAADIRRAFGQWTSDAHRIREVSDRTLIDRVAQMTRGGLLVAVLIPDPAMKSRRVDTRAELPIKLELDVSGAPDVPAMTVQQRAAIALTLAPNYLDGEARNRLRLLVAPQTLPMTAGILSAWTESSVLALGEIVDAFSLIAEISVGGPAVWESAKRLRRAAALIASATVERELDEAAREIAQVANVIGVSAFASAITHAATKRASRWGKRKQSVRRTPQ